MPEWLRKAPVRTFSLAICKVLIRGTRVYRLCRKLPRLRAASLGPQWPEASSWAMLPDPPFSGSTGTSTRAHPAFPLRQPRVTWRRDGARSHRGPRPGFSPPSGGVPAYSSNDEEVRPPAPALPPLTCVPSPVPQREVQRAGDRLPQQRRAQTSGQPGAHHQHPEHGGGGGSECRRLARPPCPCDRQDCALGGPPAPERAGKPAAVTETETETTRPACTGARRVSPESHRPLEKDLEGTASAWASEEDCSEGRKQPPWMPQLGFFWSLIGHFWWQKGILVTVVQRLQIMCFLMLAPPSMKMWKIMHPFQICEEYRYLVHQEILHRLRRQQMLTPVSKWIHCAPRDIMWNGFCHHWPIFNFVLKVLNETKRNEK